MRIDHFTFGSIRIDGVDYDHDVVINSGKIEKRKKKPSRPYREQYGHTPLTAYEDIPWNCRKLIIGTGAYGRLPVTDDVTREAMERHVDLVLLPTPEAAEKLNEGDAETNAILHVTC